MTHYPSCISSTGSHHHPMHVYSATDTRPHHDPEPSEEPDTDTDHKQPLNDSEDHISPTGEYNSNPTVSYSPVRLRELQPQWAHILIKDILDPSLLSTLGTISPPVSREISGPPSYPEAHLSVQYMAILCLNVNSKDANKILRFAHRQANSPESLRPPIAEAIRPTVYSSIRQATIFSASVSGIYPSLDPLSLNMETIASTLRDHLTRFEDTLNKRSIEIYARVTGTPIYISSISASKKSAYDELADASYHNYKAMKGLKYFFVGGSFRQSPSRNNVKVKSGPWGTTCVHITSRRQIRKREKRVRFERSLGSKALFPINSFSVLYTQTLRLIMDVAPYHLTRYPKDKPLFDAVKGITLTTGPDHTIRAIKCHVITDIIPDGRDNETCYLQHLSRNQFKSYRNRDILKDNITHNHQTLANQFITDLRSINNPHLTPRVRNELRDQLDNFLRATTVFNKPFPHPLNPSTTHCITRHIHGYQCPSHLRKRIQKLNSTFSDIRKIGGTYNTTSAKERSDKLHTVYRSLLRQFIDQCRRENLPGTLLDRLDAQYARTNIYNEDGTRKSIYTIDPAKMYSYSSISDLFREEGFRASAHRHTIHPIHAIGVAPYAKQMATILNCPQLVPIVRLFCKYAEISYNKT